MGILSIARGPNNNRLVPTLGGAPEYKQVCAGAASSGKHWVPVGGYDWPAALPTTIASCSAVDVCTSFLGQFFNLLDAAVAKGSQDRRCFLVPWKASRCWCGALGSKWTVSTCKSFKETTIYHPLCQCHGIRTHEVQERVVLGLTTSLHLV